MYYAIIDEDNEIIDIYPTEDEARAAAPEGSPTIRVYDGPVYTIYAYTWDGDVKLHAGDGEEILGDFAWQAWHRERDAREALETLRGEDNRVEYDLELDGITITDGGEAC